MLTLKAAFAKHAQERCSLEASMAKLAASEAAHRAADRAMQILASAGYRRGSQRRAPVPRRARRGDLPGHVRGAAHDHRRERHRLTAPATCSRRRRSRTASTSSKPGSSRPSSRACGRVAPRQRRVRPARGRRVGAVRRRGQSRQQGDRHRRSTHVPDEGAFEAVERDVRGARGRGPGGGVDAGACRDRTSALSRRGLRAARVRERAGTTARPGDAVGAGCTPRQPAPHPPGIDVRVAGDAETDAWVATVTGGFAAPDESGAGGDQPLPPAEELAATMDDVFRAGGVTRYLARLDGGWRAARACAWTAGSRCWRAPRHFRSSGVGACSARCSNRGWTDAARARLRTRRSRHAAGLDLAGQRAAAGVRLLYARAVLVKG